tara:strand:- start:4986 stop:6185 length:1200 start_codon:yes stop_codon:yes gene_type:complete
MTINIYNEFFSSDDSTEGKSAWGQLKRYKLEYCIPNEDICFTYQADLNKNTIYFLSLDAVSNLENGHLDFIALELARPDGWCSTSILVIDTTLEDFVGLNYYKLLFQMANRGVPANKVKIVTSQSAIDNFKEEFYCPFEVIHYDMFASAFHNHATDKNLFREIKPRQLEKHLICFMKRPRLLRVIANGFMRSRGYDKQSHYSWHFDINETRNFYDFEKTIAIVADDISYVLDDEHIKEEIYDSIEGDKEWIFDTYVTDTGGINMPMETHRRLDSSCMFDENLKILDNSFLTEKTYKNFAYGVPFIGFGIPNYSTILSDLGYHCWDNFFDTVIDNSSYKACLNSYFKLIDEICAMPLEQLQDRLNSKESLDMLQHNQTLYNQRNEIKMLIKKLNNLFKDK